MAFYYSRLSLRRIRSWYRAHPMRPKWAWHRARHGWSPRDTWSLDDYLCRVIAGSIKHLRDNGISYPAGTSMDRWVNQLTRIIEPIETWGNRWQWECTVDQAEDERRYHEAQKAFRRLGEVLASLWD
jgi:hypothetical protein